jgi:hypothetical protein
MTSTTLSSVGGSSVLGSPSIQSTILSLCSTSVVFHRVARSLVRIMRWVVSLMLRSTCRYSAIRVSRANLFLLQLVDHTGATKLRTYVLPQEYAKVKNANEAERKNETDMTLLLDGWSNARNDSVMGWMLRMRSGSAQVLGLTNISSSHHTAVNLAGAHLFVTFETMGLRVVMVCSSHRRICVKLQASAWGKRRSSAPTALIPPPRDALRCISGFDMV